MRKISIAGLMVLLMAMVVGGAGPRWVSTSHQLGGPSWVASEPEVITKIVTTRSTFPNQFLPDDSTFDIVNKADDGSALRYGWVDSSQQSTSPYNNSSIAAQMNDLERDNTEVSPRLCFVWFSLNGVKAGDRINSANMTINNAAFSTNPISGTEYLTARVDTNRSDYAMLDFESQQADLCFLDISWLYKDTDGTAEAWSPAMSYRTDYWQFGPRSSTMHDTSIHTAVQGSAIEFSLVDAIQQVVDKGQDAIDDGVIVMVYGSATESSTSRSLTFAAGSHSRLGDVETGGNPSLEIETSSRRGPRAWGNGKVPVVFTWDDERLPDHATYEGILDGTGVPFSTVAYEIAWGSGYPEFWAANPGEMELIIHSRNHIMLGDITGATLNSELEKTWVNSTNFTAGFPDTANISFAWPGGDPFIYGWEAMWKMVSYGYDSSRGVVQKAAMIGPQPYASWDAYTNLYSIATISTGSITNDGGSPVTDSVLLHGNLMDEIDKMYTDFGRSALILYAHEESDEQVTSGNLTTIRDQIDNSDFMYRASYGEVIRQLRLRPFVDVADVETQTAALVAASFQGSFLHTPANTASDAGDSNAIEFDKVDLFNQMWIGPATD